MSRLLELAGELESPAPVLRKVEELERERASLEEQRVGWIKDDEAGRALAKISEAQVRTMLRNMAVEMQTYARQELRDFLSSIVERIELDAAANTLQVCYRIPLASGNKLASPRGFEPLYSP